MSLASRLKQLLFENNHGGTEPLTRAPDPRSTIPPDGDEPDLCGQEAEISNAIEYELVPYDRSLNERCLRYWKAGDWISLAAIDEESLSCHPERATIAMIIAGACIELGNIGAARRFAYLARKWGCHKFFMSKILLAGVSATLGRLELIRGKDEQGISRFHEANRLSLGLEKQALPSEERAVREALQLGLLSQAARLINRQVTVCKSSGQAGSEGNSSDVRLSIIETELQLLHHELSLAQQRQQLFSLQQNQPDTDLKPDSSDWLEWIRRKSVSQLGQDLWVLEKTNYKRNGFFVEFGATDGVLLSNTWLLEMAFGWKGLCAEPNPKFFSQLKDNRSCIVSDACIGDETGKWVDFILSDAFGGISTYANKDKHAAKREAYRQAGKVQTVRLISLDDFLRQHKAPFEIDYISIDTEGSEYDILNAFPFHNWRIRLFTIEHNYTQERQAIRELMELNGYECTEAQWDDWFELKG